MSERAVNFIIDSLLKTIRGLVKRVGPDMSYGEDGVLLSNDQINQWRNGMADAIASHHYAAAMAGADGRDLTPKETGSVKEIVVTQIQYLDQFAAQVVSDRSFDRRMAARAESYSGAVRSSYFAGKVGFLPLPAMPAEGTICHSNCKCNWRIVTLDPDAGDYDAYWERNADDSCDTCIARERMWYPVEIRGGLLQ